MKKLLTDAFDDLIDEEDDDDQSTVSSLHQNSFRGYSLSNTGSSGSNHPSPHYITHNTHAQQQSSASPAQPEAFENGTHRSPIATQPIYENNMESFVTNDDVSQFETNLHNKNSHNGYSNDVVNVMQINSKQNGDHFGYLSSIPQADFTTNESLYASNGYAGNGYGGNGYAVNENISNGCVNDIHAHNGYAFNGNHPNEDIYRQTDIHSQDQLLVLYATRMQEISELKKELDSLRYERDSEVEQLKRKLLLAEAEKQGAFLSHKEAQNLLSEYQTQISQMRQDVEDLRIKNSALEKSKEEIARERDVAKSSAADLIQKVSILERNGKGLTSEKHMESFLKTVKQQHENQVRELQGQIESLTQKFSQKDHECCILERKLRDAQRAQEALITEKGKVVNELNKELEEAQKKVLEYTTSMNSQDMGHLKKELEQVKTERKALEQKLADTSRKLESAEKDLRQYEAVSKMGLLNNGDSSFETDSITNLGISRRHSLGGRADKSIDTNRDTSRRSKSQRERDDLTIQLRDELQRALQGQRSKREEIRRLQGELALRDQKIKTMKEQEKVYYVESENFKKNLTAVLDRLKRQEEEAKTLRGKSDEAGDLRSQVIRFKKEKEAIDKDLKDCKIQLESLRSENKSLREQLADMELELEQAKVRQVDQSAAEFLAFHDESLARLRQESSRQLEAQVVDYRVRMEQAQKECEEIKRLYIEVCSAKRALLTELQEEQAQVKKLTTDLEDVKESLQSLEELHRQERDLNRRLRDELEREKLSSSALKEEKENQLEEQVKERLGALRKEHESKLQELQKAKIEAVTQTEILRKRVHALEKDSLKLQELETECVELRKQAIEAPQRQQAEVERISRELKQSRERVIQLEKSLRTEFQSQMGAMIAERDSIQAELKQKDLQLEEYLQALSRIRPPTREIAVNTECGTLDALRKQFDEKIKELSAQFKTNEEQKLKALHAQHKVALASAEEHVKEETVKYFAEEISKMEDKHRGELGSFAKKLVEMESTFSKHLLALKNALLQKNQEVDDLKKKLKNAPETGIQRNGNGGSEDSIQLRLHVEQLKEQVESDRNNMTEALSRWANEVKDLQERETLLEKKLEELKLKYKNARKAAVHYKKLCEEKEKHMTSELTRLQAAYSKILSQVQERFAGIVNGKEQEVVEQLKRIESYYEGQMKDLENKLKNGVTIS
ncbi:Centrosomal protein of 152 kDa [Frankliniella fusca]|uniref:Centrosomal protein of 152 kDa n=1 Tax=Frankliniella fusca TaxID=407009 RepID=A0AAE1GSS3_9NEOP|nr:Centrosomal protein of 152 kDa [Frankliniella fusca]